MPLLHTVATALKPAVLIVFSWDGDETAIVRESTIPGLIDLPLTLPVSRLCEHDGVLLERDAPDTLVSTALVALLDYRPAAVLVVDAVCSEEGSRGGLLAIWRELRDIPAPIALTPRQACGALRSLLDQWLEKHERLDRLMLLEQVAGAIIEAVIYLPDHGRFAWVNNAAGRLLNLTSGTIRAPEAAAALRAFGLRVKNDKERQHWGQLTCDESGPLPDSLWEVGSDPPSFYRVTRTKSRAGLAAGNVWIFRDETAQQHVNRLLRERSTIEKARSDYLIAVLESMADAVMVVDAGSHEVLLNSEARLRFGPSLHERNARLDDVRGQALAYEGLSALDGTPDHGENLLYAALTGREVATTAVRARREHGLRELHVSVRSVRAADGSVIGAVLVERDVTEQAAAETRARQNEKLQAVGRLAAGVTHDINNMLTVMQSTLSTLSSEATTPSERQQEVETLALVLEETRLLTRGLLDFCRGRIRSVTPVDLTSLVDRLRPITRTLAVTGVQVTFVVPREETLVTLGDASELEQVLLNLCINANDAMGDGGMLTVTLSATHVTSPKVHMAGTVPPGDFVLIEVSDNGVGMSAEVMSHVFEPFFTTKSPGAGTGLGLSTVYGIVQRNGGFIGIDSVPGEGTRFCLYLPQHRSVPDGIATTPAVRVAMGTDRLDGDVAVAVRHRVMVLDDDPMVRAAVARMVIRLGHVVEQCATAVEAADRLGSGTFDVVLSDVRMPEIDGVGFVRLIRERGIEVPVVLMSGNADVEDVDLEALTGVSGFLTKPFSSAELVQRLSAAYLVSNGPTSGAAETTRRY